MKTAELQGAALDWAVAKCEGIALEQFLEAEKFPEHYYKYSTNWLSGGPIIEREKIDIEWEEECVAYIYEPHGDYVESRGPTPLIAAMRCYVASKLGDEIDVPEDLT